MVSLREPRILSVAQPWADFLIPTDQTIAWCRAAMGPAFAADLPKTIENRPWSTTHRGMTFIHATSYDRRDRNALALYGLTDVADQFVYSAVVGVVDWVDVTSDWVDREDGPDLPAWGMAGRYHHHVARPRRLRSPIACSGRLGMRHPLPHVKANVLAQLAALDRDIVLADRDAR